MGFAISFFVLCVQDTLEMRVSQPFIQKLICRYRYLLVRSNSTRAPAGETDDPSLAIIAFGFILYHGCAHCAQRRCLADWRVADMGKGSAAPGRHQ